LTPGNPAAFSVRPVNAFMLKNTVAQVSRALSGSCPGRCFYVADFVNTQPNFRTLDYTPVSHALSAHELIHQALRVFLVAGLLFHYSSTRVWGVAMLVSIIGFIGAKKHIMLCLLLLEFLSVLLIYSVFSQRLRESPRVLTLIIIFACVASEGAMALTLFLTATRCSSNELEISKV